MADNRAFLVAAAAVVLVGAAFMGTSASARAQVSTRVKRAAGGNDGSQAGVMGSAAIRTGITPQAWVPYCPPGAHLGAHRMYQHPRGSSPNFSRLTTAPDAYSWLFSPPSEVDL